MTLVEELRKLSADIPLELAETLNRLEMMEKIGASPMEVLMEFVTAIEPFRAEKPAEYDALKPRIGKFSSRLDGKQRFVWNRVFTCDSTPSD